MPSFLEMTWTRDPTTEAILGWVAVASTVGFLLAPFKDIWGPTGVYRQGSTRNLATGLPYFATFFNCFEWTLFAGLNKPLLLQPLVINIFGSAVAFTYMMCYWYYSRTRTDMIYAISGTAMVVGTSALYMFKGDPDVFGSVAAVSNILMYYAPLAALGEITRTQSVARMPLPPLVMTVIGGINWVNYGTYIGKPEIVVPNVFGIVFGVVQLAVYCKYCNPKKNDDETLYEPLVVDEEGELAESSMAAVAPGDGDGDNIL